MPVTGFGLLQQKTFSADKFGALINRQQVVLRDYLNLSTPKIEKLINSVMAAGALGCKIIGSGGGGCVLIYAPKNKNMIKQTITKCSCKLMNIAISQGTHIVK